jgi:protein SCO1/2
MASPRFAVILPVLVALGCGDARSPAATPGDLRGRVLDPPLAKPEAGFTDTEGRSFDLRAETDGFLTLLFFGYTHCPDVCPVHMANIAAVLKTLPPSITTRTKVLFVTTDPGRDTPERLRSWLGGFDPSFIGLSGDTATLNRTQAALMLPPAQIGAADSAGNYQVGHAAPVVAFTPDGLARAMYPFGIRQADWAHDLPRLMGGQ